MKRILAAISLCLALTARPDITVINPYSPGAGITILRANVTDFESGLWSRSSVTNLWAYNLSTASNAVVVTTTNGNAITFEVNGTGGGGGAAPAYTNWTFSTASNAVLVLTTNGTTINTEINGTGSGGGGGSTVPQAVTNITPTFVSGVATSYWHTASKANLVLTMTDALSDHATNNLCVGDGSAGSAGLNTLVVTVQQSDMMGAKRYYIQLWNCQAPSAATLLYLGDGLVPTSHVFQVHWDGTTNRIINAAYFLGQ